jgi:hypothetical protein
VNKNRELYRHLHDVAQRVVDAGTADAALAAALESAMVALVSQYDDAEHALETVIGSDTLLGADLRAAVTIVGKADVADDGDDDDAGDRGDDAGGLLNHPIVRLAQLLVASGHKADIASALHYLMHTSHGAALLHRTRMHKGKDSPPMQDTILSIMKDASIASVCALIVQKGSTAFTQAELVDAVTKIAAERYPALTKEQAFAKIYTASTEEARVLNSAIAVAKSMPFVADLTPLQVGGAAAQNLDDPVEAIAQLRQIGRDRWPTASEADQFERALTATENHKLARRAVPIPRAVTSFPFPR